METESLVLEPPVRTRPRVDVPHVLVYDEPPLLAPKEFAACSRPPSQLANLLAASSPGERQRLVRSALHAMGFDWLGYGRLGRRGDQLVPVSFCTTYANTVWARHYFTQSYAEIDPRLTEAFHSVLPYFWSIDDLRPRSNGEMPDCKLPSFIEGLSDAGVRSGALLVLPEAGGGEAGHFVSFLSRAPQERALQDGRLGQLLTFALCLHEFYSRYCRQPLGAGPALGGASLNPLQRNILDRVARGASDKQIAYELQLSSHAVDYHMRQLRRRFAARNRVQLTQAASRAAAG